MQIELRATDIATQLRKKGNQDELLPLLSFLATDEVSEELIQAAADRFNGSEVHRATAPWLRRLADALEAVEARDAVLDAAGRVA